MCIRAPGTCRAAIQNGLSPAHDALMSGSNFNVAIEQKMMDAMVGMIDAMALFGPAYKEYEAEPWRPAGTSSTCAFGNGA